MTDFISRMGAIEALGEEPLVWCDRDEYGQGVNDQWRCDVKALKAVPTADVAKVVKCFECKHKAEGQGYCYKHGIWLHRMKFCSVGERREQ